MDERLILPKELADQLPQWITRLPRAPDGRRVINWLALAGLLLVALWSSFYMVGRSETATIRRLGVFSGTSGPGLHLKLPFVDQVALTDTQNVRRLELGFRTVRVGPPAEYKDIDEEALMVSSDENLVDVDFVVQYRAADAAKWQFNSENPDALVFYLAEAAMRLVVGQTSFDAVVTTGKEHIQTAVAEVLQGYCEKLDIGAKILSVQMQDVRAPKGVDSAFKDVINAREDKNRSINQAEGYRNEVLPKARGQAAGMVAGALGYKEQRLAAARGDASAFLALAAEYQKAPELTARRLVNEAWWGLLDKRQVILDNTSGKGLPLLKQLHLEGK